MEKKVSNRLLSELLKSLNRWQQRQFNSAEWFCFNIENSLFRNSVMFGFGRFNIHKFTSFKQFGYIIFFTFRTSHVPTMYISMLDVCSMTKKSENNLKTAIKLYCDIRFTETKCNFQRFFCFFASFRFVLKIVL